MRMELLNKYLNTSENFYVTRFRHEVLNILKFKGMHGMSASERERAGIAGIAGICRIAGVLLLLPVRVVVSVWRVECKSACNEEMRRETCPRLSLFCYRFTFVLFVSGNRSALISLVHCSPFHFRHRVYPSTESDFKDLKGKCLLKVLKVRALDDVNIISY